MRHDLLFRDPGTSSIGELELEDNEDVEESKDKVDKDSVALKAGWDDLFIDNSEDDDNEIDD
jgi:hypothetical protein